jgi:DNA (cytosine-5)-methyltransferase 1
MYHYRDHDFLTPEYLDHILGGLIVDSFAGGGGASTGIEEALGRSPNFAINHDSEALCMHEANHPDTVHLTHDIWKVKPLEVTRGACVGLLWASPDCKSHSRAAGGKPRAKNIRDLAWVVVHWAKVVRPKLILLENVAEFAEWGPLTLKGQPCPRRKGQTFADWVSKLERQGYQVDYRMLKACDYGAPTIRERLFLVARCDDKPIVWPERTHAPADDPRVLAGELLPYRTAADIIDWQKACPSIFMDRDRAQKYRDDTGLTVKRPLEDATLARIAKGVKRYVIDAEQPFITSLTHQGGDRNEALSDPLKTITAANRGEKALVAPELAPFMTKFRKNAVGASIHDPLPTVTANSFDKRAGCGIPMGVVAPEIVQVDSETARASTLISVAHGDSGGKREYPMDEPLGTATASNTHAVAMVDAVAPVITYSQQGGAVRSPEAPLHTVTASSKDYNAIIAPYLATYYSTKPGGQPRTASLDEPLRTQTTENRHGLAVPYLVPRYGERPGQEPRTVAINRPAPTIVPDGNQGSLAMAELVPTNETLHANAVIRHFGGSVGSSADEPIGTTTCGGGGKTGVIAAELAHALEAAVGFIAQQNTGEVGHDARKPLSTIVGKGCTQTPVVTTLVQAEADNAEARHIVKFQENSVGTALDEPLHTVMAGATRHGVVSSHIINMKGSDQRAAPVDAPMPAACAGGNHIGEVAADLQRSASIVTYYGTDQTGAIEDPLHTVTTKGRFGLVDSHATHSLTPEQYEKAREVAAFLRAFDCWDGGEIVVVRGYVIVDIGLRMLSPRELARGQGFREHYVLDPKFNGKRLTKTSQTRMIGNSVCPDAARAMVFANVVIASQMSEKPKKIRPWGAALRELIRSGRHIKTETNRRRNARESVPMRRAA